MTRFGMSAREYARVTHRERMAKGELRICPECAGDGVIPTDEPAGRMHRGIQGGQGRAAADVHAEAEAWAGGLLAWVLFAVGLAVGLAVAWWVQP